MRWGQFGKRDADLERELRSDLELEEYEQRESGLSQDQARLAARRAFGNPSLIREQIRETWRRAPFERLCQDIRYAARQLRRSLGFTSAVLAILALGIGATTTLFTLVYSTLLRSLPYHDADRIVRIHDVRLQGRSTGGLVAVPRFFDVVARSKSFANAGFYYFEGPALTVGGQLPIATKGAGANAGFWKVYDVSPLLGRTFSEEDDQPNAPMVAVLSYEAWRHIFGSDPDVVGRDVTIDGKSTTIVGVMPKGFNVPAGIDLWRPAQFSPSAWTWRGDGSRFINVVARLAPGVSIGSARGDLERIGEQLGREHSDTDGMWRFEAPSLRDDLYGELKPAMLVLFIAAAFLLIVACMNVANLLLARAATRQREVALRRALGASEGRIRRQFLTEAVVLSLSGGIAGLGLTFLLVRTLAVKLPGRLGVPGTIEMDWPVVWFAFGLAVACGIAFGAIPAVRNRRVTLNTAMQQGSSQLAGRFAGRTRSTLISVQVAISLVLLVGASLFGESLWNLLKFPLGFVPENVLTFRIGLPWNAEADATRQFFANVQHRLAVMPGVLAVGQTSALPTEDWHARGNFDADWLPYTAHHDAVNAEVRSVSGDFLRALGTPLLSGRDLIPGDAVSTPVPVLVNRTFAQQYLREGNLIGRHMTNGTGSMEIVGIIADVRGTAGSLAGKVGPEIYTPADGKYPVVRRSFILRSKMAPEDLVPSIREAVHNADPQVAVANAATMDELLDKSVAQPRLSLALIAAFALIALVLACVGIYGVVALSVTQRTREIGVRMALGATRGQILRLFLNDALKWALWGILAGTAVALLLTTFLRSQLYGVAPGNPFVYALSIPALILPIFIATLRPAFWAASINPVDALRNE
jgi:putative ABC transport system permease protein